jgi:peptidoglycan/xylan/chitin deacetylase (PgdA/CDA1 family)
MAGQVALTFDDGPDPVWTPQVLDELDRAGAPATFFVLSSRAACYPELLDRMVASGHEIGFHGNLHLRHDEHHAAVVERDTAEGLELLGRHRPRLWRAPHGVVEPVTEQLAARHGMELVHWSADTVDWEAGQVPEAMLARVEHALVPGAVVLMHDAVGPGSPRRDPSHTVALVGPLVEAIRERGLEPGLIPRQAEPEKSRIWSRVTSRMSRASR